MIPAWVRVSLAMVIAGAGANIFAAMLPVYRNGKSLSQSDVTLMLAVYVLGLIPALILGGPASDKFGRRALIRPALLFSGLGSLLLLLAHWGGNWLIHCGRLSAGVAIGFVMASGAAWLKELSSNVALGAKRATIATSAGFGIGPLVGGAVAQWCPDPDLIPLLIHSLAVVAVIPFVWNVPEQKPSPQSAVAKANGFRVALRHPHFLRAVAAWAPWVFGCATTSFAVLTTLVEVQYPVAFTGLVAALTMLGGAAVQPLVPRLRWHPATVGLLLAAAGMVIGIIVSLTHNAWVVIAGALVLGSSYGVMMVSGLREVQQIASPGDLGALTGVYYSLTYVGFFAPFVISFTAPRIGYFWIFSLGIVIIFSSLVPVRRAAQSAIEE